MLEKRGKMKKKLTLYVDQNVVKQAKAQGLNISQFLETQLLRVIPILEQGDVVDTIELIESPDIK